MPYDIICDNTIFVGKALQGLPLSRHGLNLSRPVGKTVPYNIACGGHLLILPQNGADVKREIHLTSRGPAAKIPRFLVIMVSSPIGKFWEYGMRFNKTELEQFRKILRERRAVLNGFVNRMQDEALNKSRDDSGGDFNHMADMGTDNYDQEFTLGLIENEEGEVREIDLALKKIADGTYGLCEGCGCNIPKTRLKALPSARTCVQCKEAEEKRS